MAEKEMTVKDMYIPSVNDAVNLITRYYRDGEIKKLKLVKEYLESNDISRYIAGDADRFHNATVTLTRIGFYDYAYALAKVGHTRYPKNTDLLGDLLCYGMQCRDLEDLEKWYTALSQINKRFWTWRAYQFSFDYWMKRLPEAKGEELFQWEETIKDIFSRFQDNFRFIMDKSVCEKAFMMKYEYYASKGDDFLAEEALKEATRNEDTKNKCPQCALRLADYYFEKGNYAESLKYSNLAAFIKEDQQSISLGYTNYIRAMSMEYIMRNDNSIVHKVATVYNAYYAAVLYLREEDGRDRLISSIKKQVNMLERETGIESNIIFEDNSSENLKLQQLLQLLNNEMEDQQ